MRTLAIDVVIEICVSLMSHMSRPWYPDVLCQHVTQGNRVLFFSTRPTASPIRHSHHDDTAPRPFPARHTAASQPPRIEISSYLPRPFRRSRDELRPGAAPQPRPLRTEVPRQAAHPRAPGRCRRRALQQVRASQRHDRPPEARFSQDTAATEEQGYRSAPGFDFMKSEEKEKTLPSLF